MKNLIVVIFGIYFCFGIINHAYPQLFLPGNTSTGPSGDIINDLRISQKGEVLYATNYGANIYNKDQSTWQNYTITNGVTDINVNIVFRDSKDNLWIGTNLGLSKINNHITVYSSEVKSEVNAEAPHIISTIYKHSSYSTDPNYKPEKWGTVEEIFPDYKEIHPVYLYGTKVTTIFEDRDGRILIGTELGLSVREDDIWTVHNNINGIDLDGIQDIKQTKEGNIWIATSYGLIEWDGENATHYLDGKTIYNICIDDKNNLWCGERSVLYQFDGNNWHSWPIEDHSRGKRYLLSIDYDLEGNIWCGTNSGVLVFDGENWLKKFESDKGMLCDTIDCLVYDHLSKQVRIGTPKGASILEDNIWNPVKRSTGMSSANINCIEYDGKNIWAGTDNGLFKIDEYSKSVPYNNSMLCNNFINDLSWNNSTLWIATDGGVSKLRLQNQQQFWTSYLSDTSYSNDPGFVQDEPEYFIPSYYWRDKKWARILDNKVFSVEADDDKVWFGTQEGISKFEGSNWKSYDADPNGGLYHCPIDKIQFFEDKTYLSSSCGISERYDANSHYIMNNNKYPYFFHSIERIGSFYADKMRKLWFSGEGRSKSVSNDEDVTFIYTIYGNTFEINYGKLLLNKMAENKSEPYVIESFNGETTAYYFDRISPLHYDENKKTLYVHNCLLVNNYWYKLNGNNIQTNSNNPIALTPFSYYGPYQKQKAYYLGDIQDILTDKDGNVWYATTLGLVKHTEPTATKPTSTTQNKNNNVLTKLKVQDDRIILDNFDQEIEITICDVMGRIIFNSNATNLHNHPRLKPGVYLINLYINGKVINKRVLVNTL